MVDLPTLIAEVDARHASDPLEGIEHATAVAAELADLSDRLIGYYVERARADGHSWADIGALVGISRQAAQQRFGARQSALTLADLEGAGGLARTTRRTRDTLTRAEGHARRLRHPTLAPVHLLLAILEDRDTLAARALDRLGVRRSDLRRAAGPLLARGAASPAQLPIDPATRRVLGHALTDAVGLGHNYIGTEHLLLGMVREAPELLRGVEIADARAAVGDLLDEYLRQRT